MTDKVQMRPVDSSTIAAIGFDPQAKVLHVVFKNGSRYIYQDFPMSLYEEFLAAPSAGKFFAQKIKGGYEWVKACTGCGHEITPETRVDIEEFKDLCYPCYKLKPKHVCVDFDGVLAEYTGWKGPDHLGDPRPGAKHFLQMVVDQGMKVIILTTRDPDAVHTWLIDHAMHDLVDRVTRQKPPAIAYLDDRAICFRGNFVEAYANIMHFKPYWRQS